MRLTVYNMEEVAARNILSSTSRNDMNVVKDFPCLARVQVLDSHFRWGYLGPEKYELYIEVTGQVNSFFIDNEIVQGPEVFPCNTTEIETTSPIPVRYKWRLSCEEQGDGVRDGAGYGIETPAVFKNNVLDFNVKIDFVGIYDTPCCFVSIPNQFDLKTSTHENRYFGVMQMVEPHPEALAERQRNGELQIVSENEWALSQQRAVDDLGDEYLVQPEEQAENNEPNVALTDEQKTSEQIAHVVDDIVNAAQDSIAARANKDDPDVWDDFLASARENDDANKGDDVQQRDMYGHVIGQQSAAPTGKISYDALNKEAVRRTQNKEELEKNRAVDRAQDLKALNENPNADISGQGATMTEEDIKRAKAEKDSKKQIQAARNADIVSDLAAFNAGSTDVAGQGSAAAPKEQPKSAQALLANLFPKKNPDRQAEAEAIKPKPTNPSTPGNDGRYL